MSVSGFSYIQYVNRKKNNHCNDSYIRNVVKYFTIYNDLAQLRKNVIEFIFLRVGNLTTSFVVIDDVPSKHNKVEVKFKGGN